MILFYNTFLIGFFYTIVIQLELVNGNNNTFNADVKSNINITKSKVLDTKIGLNQTDEDKTKTYIETEIGILPKNVIDKQKNVIINQTNTIYKPKNVTGTQTEDVPNIPRGRENVVDNPKNLVNTQSSNNRADNGSENVQVDQKPKQDPIILQNENLSEKNDHKNSMPRKGADNGQLLVNATNLNITPKPNISLTPMPTRKVTIMNTTTTTIRPRKPTVTVGDDDGLNNQSSKDETNISNAETIIVNSHKSSSNFVVPIVAVILSVPFVAIIISILYKKGTEWWQHRHYSRMDFLIDGMYNT